MYTYAGDLNLDGKINADDYFNIDSHYNKFADSDKSYFNGDVDYNGRIDGDDYAAMDNNFSTQGSPFPSAGLPGAISAVPEPASLGLLLTGSLLLTRRRRDRR